MQTSSAAPRWMARVLRFAAACDVLCGSLLLLLPTAPFTWAGMAPPESLAPWQALGLTIGTWGLGYLWVARRPFQLWPMVLVGLLGKVLLPIGFVLAAAGGHLPWELGLLVVAHGPLWWVPLGLILRGAARSHRAEHTPPVLPLDIALSLYRDEADVDLLEASRRQPLFLVFLRHFGCTFCREALADLAAIHDRLRAAGARLVLVHMSTEGEACEMFDSYGLREVTAISDPERLLYRAFALRRGTPAQLLGWSVWKRGWEAGVKNGHGIGWLRGDGAQMPGAFVVSHGRIVAQFVHETASDRPDYVILASEGVDHAKFQQDLEADGVSMGFQERLRRLLSAEARNET